MLIIINVNVRDVVIPIDNNINKTGREFPGNIKSWL